MTSVSLSKAPDAGWVSVTGAFGDEYAVAGQAIGPGLYPCRDRAGRDRLYKLFNQPVTDAGVIGWVARAVCFGREIVFAAEDRVGSAGVAASAMTWPIDLVKHENTLLGVVLPSGPGDFQLPDGSMLTFDQLYTRSAAPPDAYLRVAVLIRACEIVEVLDETSLVHGERFGLAVLIYRGLFQGTDVAPHEPGPWQPPSGIPRELDSRLLGLFDRAFGVPHVRPSAGEWRVGLREAFLTADGTHYRADALTVLDRRTTQFAPAAPLTPPPAPAGWQPPPARATGVLIAAILLVVAALVGVAALVTVNMRETDEQTAAPTTTYSYSPSEYYTPTTAPFDWSRLNAQATDPTPFTSEALLPQSFRDAKNVEYTLRAGGVKDCVTNGMSQNVKDILSQYGCSHMIAGSYIDASDQILVSVNVMAFPTTDAANTLYETMKGQTQDWAVWCPQHGVGSAVCDSDISYATRSGWGAQNYRYVYESTALYINLTQDTDIKDWLDAAAREAVLKSGPENHWPK
ncbi:hypothetical protein [Nocardia sp. NPDC050406]|uniref:hypothetical protein n=1 Tax=Nocardia sp. NPDC050406 TaxID=3364318 RepID=UPI003798E05E